jgi:[ribosomal protein S5]-alanine N-acetyltransferase
VTSVGLSIGHSLCTLRQWREGDEQSLAANANNKKIWMNLRDVFPFPYTLKNAVLWIELSKESKTNFAIDVDGQAVGDIALTMQGDLMRRSAELGYWLGEAYWGRGIMTEAVRAMTDYAFQSFDINRVFAGILEYNAASARVLEKNGYVCEGRLRQACSKEGKLYDQLIFATVR